MVLPEKVRQRKVEKNRGETCLQKVRSEKVQVCTEVSSEKEKKNVCGMKKRVRKRSIEVGEVRGERR